VRRRRLKVSKSLKRQSFSQSIDRPGGDLPPGLFLSDNGRRRQMPAKAPRRRARAPFRRKVKRPVGYSHRLANQILDLMAEGERLSGIGRRPKFPCRQTIYEWAKRDPEFGEAFAVAQLLGVDARADKVLDIAEAATKETLAVDRLHVGSLKWHVARDDKAKGDEPDRGAGRFLDIRIRQFERVVRDDGSAYVREVLPSGEVLDLG
jgi:hypothetical protein